MMLSYLVCRIQYSNELYLFPSPGSQLLSALENGVSQYPKLELFLFFDKCGKISWGSNLISYSVCKVQNSNEVYLFSSPGSQLLSALENGVSQYPKLEGRFPQVAGVSFIFDPAQEMGKR